MSGKKINAQNKINQDILTLIRELAIVREENISLREENALLTDNRKKLKHYRTLIYKLVGFLCWLSNNYNESISKQAIVFLNLHKKLVEDCEEKPVKYTGYYKKLIEEKAEAEKLIE